MKFFNVQLLKQARGAIKRMIEESPEEITILRKSMVDDGFDGLVINPYGDPEEINIKARLSHEKQFPGNYKNSPAGLSTNLSRFILTDHETVIYDGDSFESSFGKEYKIGAVDLLIKFNGTIGYQAPLIEAVTMGET